ncbi:IS3 family transposase [Streptomyces sp. NBC_00038]|uniref:IS3 family transposase n=1 Tax=Streptomyces sp. NBC_00038 TaxID=2903615 RepID=UPI002258F461|nr:IS3 family transposase [Streptomyces sp. NBC_00038]MCX5563008.1 hypothetical protein [Streptomyces sp. NBC_00038]
MAREHLPVQLACRVLHVAESGYYAWRDRPPSNRLVKHAWLTEAIVGIHTASRGTCGTRREHAEFRLCLSIHVSHGTVELLIQRAGLHGNRRPRARHVTPTVADLVERNFTRHARDQLWVTDITARRDPDPGGLSFDEERFPVANTAAAVFVRCDVLVPPAGIAWLCVQALVCTAVPLVGASLDRIMKASTGQGTQYVVRVLYNAKETPHSSPPVSPTAKGSLYDLNELERCYNRA